MKLFRHHNRQEDAKSRRIYAAYELAYTIVDFGAAFAFFIGSVLFLLGGFHSASGWFFVAGSVLFMAKPTIRLAREIKLAGTGDIDNLAKRYEKS